MPILRIQAIAVLLISMSIVRRTQYDQADIFPVFVIGIPEIVFMGFYRLAPAHQSIEMGCFPTDLSRRSLF
jgi:hypothetical protein